MNDQNRYRGNSAQRYSNEGQRSSWNRDDQASLLDRGNTARRAERDDDRDAERDHERSFNEQDREYRAGNSGNSGFARNRDYHTESSGYGAQSYGAQSYGAQSYGAQSYNERDRSFERERSERDRDQSRDRDYGSGSFRSAPRPGPGYNDSRDYSSSSYDSRIGGYRTGSNNTDAYGSRPYRTDEYGTRQDPYGTRSDTHGLRQYGYDRNSNDSAYSIATRGVSYSGRGPKGYTRSDERIREDICERLSDHDEVDASEIEVQVKDRRVTLTGSVQNRRMKHLAEDIAEEVTGVDDVDNRVAVTKPFFKDIADRLTGSEGEQHYAHSGTKNGSGISSTSSSTQSANGRS